MESSDAQGGAAGLSDGQTLDLVSEIVDYAIIGLDPDGVIRSWNAGAQLLQGYSVDDAIGQHFSMFYVPEDRDARLPDRLLETARRQGRVTHTGWRVRKDGSRFWADAVITALHDDDGAVRGFAKVTRDRTAEHELQEALTESETRLRILVSQVADYAIIALDLRGTILSWNAGAEQLKGYSAAEAIGQHFSMFYVPDDRAAGLPDDLLELARTEGRSAHTGWRVRKDGTRFWGDVVITALHDDNGAPTGYAKVTRDRTDQHRLEELQNSLFAMLSHDIRQPLTAIGIHADLIADLDRPTRHEYAERILVAAEQLESMIGTLFDHARLRAGVVAVYPDPLPLGPALREAVAANGHLLNGREVTVDDDGVVAMADAVALRRVLANLVVNAAKYSPSGSPIDLIARAVADRAEIRIVDHGRGVAAEDIPNIFTEFYRGRLAVDNDGGSGLGLASVRHLVERQDGTVRMDSTLGVGTTVIVTLPRATDNDPDDTDEPAAGP